MHGHYPALLLYNPFAISGIVESIKSIMKINLKKG